MFEAPWSADVCLHSRSPCHTTQCGSRNSSTREKAMGKGNNSQKNDKKNKKAKKDSKKKESKSADMKR
jgi:hypothetical protein